MSTEHTILSLDLGSNTGWCLVRGGVIVESGVLRLNAKDTHPGMRWARFHNFLVKHKAVREICYEDVPGFQSTAAAKVHCALLGLVQFWCHTQHKQMTAIKPKTVKKEFTGNGNADKFDMCRTAHRLGWQHGHPDTDLDHDEADALALVWVKLKRCGIEPQLQVH